MKSIWIGLAGAAALMAQDGALTGELLAMQKSRDAMQRSRDAAQQAQEALQRSQDAMRKLTGSGYSPDHPAYRSMRDRYESGTRLLDAHRYEEAIRAFEAVAAEKADRADGALYWEAYALNRAGRRDRALQVLEVMRKQFPNSRWLADAQALEVEVKQGTGAAVSPADESNEDIKLMAINSLMNADPERALPLLEGILKGNAPPKVKDRALFVLTQNRSARAQQVLADYAKGAGNPDLQMTAVRYMGMSGTPQAQQQLAGIYSASNDTAVKREVLRGLTIGRAKDQIFSIAKAEKDESLRIEAIRQLGAMRATDLLAQLDAGGSMPVQIELMRAYMMAGSYDRIAEFAKTAKDSKLRIEAVRMLISRKDAGDLAGLYTGESDAAVKREILNAMRARGDAKSMVEIARKESDPAAKRHIVAQLATMHNSKEATDYMMELLK